MAQAEWDGLLRKSWEVENPHFQEPTLSTSERSVVKHFEETHYRDQDGKFVVPLPGRIQENAMGVVILLINSNTIGRVLNV